MVGLDQNNVATVQQTFVAPGGNVSQMLALDGVFRAVSRSAPTANPGIGFTNCAAGGLANGYGLRFTRQKTRAATQAIRRSGAARAARPPPRARRRGQPRRPRAARLPAA
jgi:hypothetical protein